MPVKVKVLVPDFINPPASLITPDNAIVLPLVSKVALVVVLIALELVIFAVACNVPLPKDILCPVAPKLLSLEIINVPAVIVVPPRYSLFALRVKAEGPD